MGRQATYKRFLYTMSSGRRQRRLYWPAGDTPWIEMGRGRREAIIDTEAIKEMEEQGLIENVANPELPVKCFMATGREVSDG